MRSAHDLLNDVILDLPALLRSSGEAGGIWESLFRGIGQETVSLRPYETGDRPRNIDRQSFVRFQRGERDEILTREYIDERNLNVWICIDLSMLYVRNGPLISPYAKYARENALVFSAIIMGSADFWRIPVGLVFRNGPYLYEMELGNGREYFGDMLTGIDIAPVLERAEQTSVSAWRETFEKTKRSLVFFISGFVSDSDQHVAMLKEIRIQQRADIVPVYLDPSGIRNMVKGAWDVGGFVTNTKGRRQLAQESENRLTGLSDLFTEALLSWIHLTEPDIQQIQKRMTDCFIEKHRNR